MTLLKRLKAYRKKSATLRRQKRGIHEADENRIRRNISFLKEERFVTAWGAVEESYRRSNHGLPDVRWRCLIALQVARQAMLVDGDFVECGTNRGIFSTAICRDLQFESVPRSFYLFDTFEGIPSGGSSPEHLEEKGYYPDCYEDVKVTFSKYPNVKIVRGILPDTLSALNDVSKISYLSIDLNSATYEMQVMEVLWDKVVRGGIVLIDDYGFNKHEEQYRAWNSFAERRGQPIIYSPTGQGIIVKGVA